MSVHRECRYIKGSVQASFTVYKNDLIIPFYLITLFASLDRVLVPYMRNPPLSGMPGALWDQTLTVRSVALWVAVGVSQDGLVPELLGSAGRHLLARGIVGQLEVV